MKLKHLLLTALLTVVGIGSSWAQQAWTDVTSKITNPSFETDEAIADLTTATWSTSGVTGWTILPATASNAQVGVGNSSSKIQGGAGASSNAAAGDKYFYTRNNWNANTNFSVEQTISTDLPAGLYMLTLKIKTASSEPGKTKWTISLQEGNKTAVTNTNAGSAAEWLSCGVLINKTDDNTSLTIKANMLPGDANGGRHYVMMIDDVQLKYFSASDIKNLSEENTLDMSGVIYNAGIYNASKTAMPRGWVAYKSTRGNSNYTEGTGDTRLEGWSNGNLDIDYYQQVVGLMVGRYRMIATCGDSNDKGAYAYIYNNGTGEKVTVDMGQTAADITTPVIEVKQGDAVNIGIAADNINDSWVTGDNFRLEYLGAIIANEADYSDLADAITAAEAKTLGFAEGEYAPYTNTAALVALKNAKAIDKEKTNYQIDVQAATTALTSATWTPNTEEINAVYNGNFDKSEVDGAPTGWITGNSTTMGGTGHARVLGYTESGNKTNFDIFGTQFGQTGETRYAFYARLDRSNAQRDTKFTYGTVDGYTMPLKAGVYSIKLKSGGWGQDNKSFKVSLTSENGTEIASQKIDNIPLISDGNGNAVQFYFKAVLSEAGNYRLVITNGNTGEDNAQCVSNIEIFRVPETTIAGRTVTADYNWGTFISEVDRTIPVGLKAYSCAEVNDDVLTLESASPIKANTPYILENTTNEDITIDDVHGQSLKVKDSYTTGLLTGVYERTQAPVGSYVLQKQNETVAFYLVVAGENQQPYVPANRAYLTTSTPGSAFYFDTETAIEAVEALTTGEAEIYDLNGMKQQSLQKGINIVKLANGKTQKVLVK